MSKITDIVSSDSAKNMFDMGASVYGGINPIFGNIYAGKKNADAVNKKRGEIADWERETRAAYERKINQDFFDTNLGAAVFDKASGQLTTANRNVDSAAEVTGATDEAKLAAKSANQQNFGNTLQGISSQSTQRNDRLLSEYQYNKGQVMAKKLGLLDDDIASAQAQQKNSGQLIDTAMSIISFL